MVRRLLPNLARKFSISWILWILWALWAAAILGAALRDGVLLLDSRGRGLVEHFGFQAFFLSVPILLLGTHYARRDLRDSIRRLIKEQPTYIENEALETEISALTELFPIKSGWGYMFVLFCFVGLVFSLTRFSELGNPEQFWGNDVFNSTSHFWSYIVANGFLLILWSTVYPAIIVQILHTMASALFIVPRSITRGIFHLDLLHPDGHGGLTKLASINAYLTLLYAIPAALLLLLYLTHDEPYFSLRFLGLLLLSVFLVHTVLGLASTAYSIAVERDRVVADWNKKIIRLMSQQRLGATATLVAFKYRDSLLSVSLFPYKRSAIFAAGALGLILSGAVFYLQLKTS